MIQCRTDAGASDAKRLCLWAHAWRGGYSSIGSMQSAVSQQPPHLAPSSERASSLRTFETLSRVVQEVEQYGAL
jgi:hypothetical protein